MSSDDDIDDNEDFYTPGPDILFNIRSNIKNYSFEKANKRLKLQYDLQKNFNSLNNLKFRRSIYNNLSNLSLQGSQIISNRFTSSISYSNNLNSLAVSSWNGNVYLLNPFDLSILKTFNNLNNEKILSSTWNNINNSLFTGGSDGKINIILNPFNKEIDQVSNIISINAHNNSRINDIKFHPTYNYFTSASSDFTWKLWDIETNKELFTQEGHSDIINSLSYHPDGSLLASAGNDSILKLWDLRSGNLILNLNENQNDHTNSIHSLDWRLNGYHLASGGSDNQLIIWDIRMMKKLSNVLSHNKLITNIKFTNSNNETLLSTGYDGNLSLTSCDNWITFKKLNTLDKIMSLEIIENDDNNNNNNTDLTIFTGGWDRSVKLFKI